MVGPVNPLHPRRSGRSRPSVMAVLRQSTLRVAGVGLTWLYTLYRVHPAVWRLMARNYRPWMGRFARLHAWMTCQFAWLEVPAYRDFLHRSGWGFRWFRLGSYPPTDKQNYVAAYPEEQRCRRGELEIEGSVVDESSGSSGRPFNWVRSGRELRSVHKNLAGFTTMIFPSRRRFVINAYSMGAWATGTNTGIAMARIAMVKNTGAGPGEDHRHAAALRAGLRLRRHGVPAVPQAFARQAGRRRLPVGPVSDQSSCPGGAPRGRESLGRGCPPDAVVSLALEAVDQSGAGAL